MSIKKVAFVSFRTKDVAADKRFWGELLGLKLANAYQDKWVEFDAPDGKTVALDGFSPPGTGPYLALETDDIEAEVARLERHGVEVLMNVRDNKVCKMAIVKDSEGNGLMLHEIAPERAK